MNKPDLIGTCWEIETSFGDDRPTWRVYRRVTATIGDQTNGWAACHRFEVRADGSYVLFFADPIATRILMAQNRIGAELWAGQYREFVAKVSEPWNVE